MDGLTVEVTCLTGDRVDVSAVPVSFGLLVTITENGSIVIPSDSLSHDSGNLHHVDVDRVIDEVGGGTAVKSEPVSKTGSLGREVRMSVAGLVEGHTVEPIHHGIHVLFDDLSVTVLDVHLPRNLANSCRPCGTCSERRIVCAVVSRNGGTDTSGNLSVTSDTLVSTESYHPLTVEVLGVCIVDTCTGVCLCVTGPTHTLVTLRAVSRNGEEVTELAALDILEQLVYELVSLSVRSRGDILSGRNL